MLQGFAKGAQHQAIRQPLQAPIALKHFLGMMNFEHFAEIYRAKVQIDQKHANRQAKVAHAVGDKRLVGGIGGARALEVKANEQVGANAHQFPAHEYLKEVVRQDQVEH